LSQMFCPGIHLERLQILVRDLSIAEDSPPVSTIATSDASILIDHVHELCFLFSNDNTFDSNQDRSLIYIRSEFLNENRHAPVVPGAQICRRSRKWCEQDEYRTPECSNSGRDKSDSGA